MRFSRPAQTCRTSGLPQSILLRYRVRCGYAFLQGVIVSYSAIALVTIKEFRSAAVADQLLMKKALASHDITAYEIPETRDQIRLATMGRRALPTAFTGSVRSSSALRYRNRTIDHSDFYHPLIAAIVFLPGDISLLQHNSRFVLILILFVDGLQESAVPADGILPRVDARY